LWVCIYVRARFPWHDNILILNIMVHSNRVVVETSPSKAKFRVETPKFFRDRELEFGFETEIVSGHLPEKWRHFVFPERFLCFGVRVRIKVYRARIEVRVRVSGNTFKYVSVKRSVVHTGKCTRSDRDIKGLSRNWYQVYRPGLGKASNLILSAIRSIKYNKK